MGKFFFFFDDNFEASSKALQSVVPYFVTKCTVKFNLNPKQNYIKLFFFPFCPLWVFIQITKILLGTTALCKAVNDTSLRLNKSVLYRSMSLFYKQTVSARITNYGHVTGPGGKLK